MKSLLPVFLLCIIYSACFAQKEATYWLDPQGPQMKFVDDTAQVIPPDVKSYGKWGQKGVAFSDKETGELLFFTTDNIICNNRPDTMEGSTGRLKIYGGAQSHLIVPFPDGSPRFYAFGYHPSLTTKRSYLFYSIIDIRKPPGKVIKKNIIVCDSINYAITGTADCTNEGYWVIVRDRYKAIFYSYHITNKGFDTTPVVSDFGERLNPNEEMPDWYNIMKISPDGTKFVFVPYAGKGVYYFDFDNNTGKITNKRYIAKVNDIFGGVSFSSNSKVLYATPAAGLWRGVYQYDLRSNDEMTIRNSEYRIFPPISQWHTSPFPIQMGPNKKIYLLNGFSYDVIHNPNTLGNGCNFEYNAIGHDSWNDVPTQCQIPNYMEHIFSDDYKGYVCFEPRGLLDTVYGCSNEFVRLTHRYSDGVIVKRSWAIENNIVYQAQDSNVIFKPQKAGSYRVRLICERTHRKDTLYTYAIIRSAGAYAGKDTNICTGMSVQIGSSGEPSTVYRWYPTEGLNYVHIPNPIASPTKNTQYIVTAITSGGCVGYDTVNIEVYPPVEAKIEQQDTTICAGTPILLMASGGEQYEWFPKKGLNNYLVPNPIANPKETIRYTVIVSNTTCSDSAFVTITVQENEKADAGMDKELCAGLSVQLGTTENPQLTYSWTPVDYLDNPNNARPVCTPEKNMQYIVTVKNPNGCESYDTVNVTLGGTLSVFAGKDTSICTGKSVQLQAEGAEKYEWSPAEGLNRADIFNPIATPSKTTTYYVKGKSGNCEGRDSILITVKEKPNIIVSDDKEICNGENVQLNVSGAEQYEWSPSEGLNTTNIANPIASPNTTTTYYVIGKNGNCASRDSVLITVKERPELTISADTEICIGESVQLNVSGAEVYEWSPSEGLDRTDIANPVANPTKTTTYYVTGKNSICEDKDSIIITVNPKPELKVSNDMTICLGESAQLFASGAESYEWSPTEYLDNAFIANPITKPEKDIIYTVKGITGNCIDTKNVRISVKADNTVRIVLTVNKDMKYAAGSLVPIRVIIPSGLNTAEFSIYYDKCCVLFERIVSADVVYTIQSQNENSMRFSIDNPTKSGGIIDMEYIVVLPPDGRMTEKFTLEDISTDAHCTTVEGSIAEIEYDPSCAWQFRGVQITEKFAITVQEEKALLYTGLGGKTTLSIYDMTGQEVWKAENTYPSSSEIEITLPELSGGVYILRASNYVWKKDVVMVR